MTFTGLAAVLRDLRRWHESERLVLQVLEDHPRSMHALALHAALCMDLYETDHDNDRLAEAERIPTSAAHGLRGRLAALQRA